MSPDYKVLCAELEEAYTWCIEEYMTAPAEEDTLIQRARATLAQPELVPVAPTDEDLYNLWEESGFESDRFARAVLTRWGTSTFQPVS